MAASEGAGTEVEWQFDAASMDAVRAWLTSADVVGFTIGPAGTSELHDTYLDTGRWRLHRAGYTCRVRQAGAHRELTLKRRAPAVDGIRRREEVTQPVVTADPAGVLAEEGAATRLLSSLLAADEIRVLFTIETRRERFELRSDGRVIAEIALDTVTIAERDPIRFTRVEVEVLGDAEDAVRPFVDRFAAALSLRESRVSKFRTGLAAAGLEPPGQFEAQAPEL